MLITIATFREPQEAHMLRHRLWAEGIFAAVSHQFHIGNNWPYSTALGGVKVEVLRMQAEDAMEIRTLCRTGHFALELPPEESHLGSLRCPRCGSTGCWKRRPIYQGVLAVSLVFFVGMLPPWRWIYFCNACGLRIKDRYGLIGKVPSGLQLPFVFQDAVLADVPDMQELHWLTHQTSLGRTSDPTWREKMLRHNSGALLAALELAPTQGWRGWVCRLEGVLRGFSIADLNTGRVSALYVDPDFERNGIGRQLHNSAVEWLFANGFQRISVIAAPYTRAQKFLHTAGWRLVDAEANGEYRLELAINVWRVRRRKF